MNPRWKYLVAPCGQEYNNLKIIAGKSLILNTSLEDAKYVNRIGVVLSTPKDSEIPINSFVVVHHNVFRTYYDAKGKQRKSNEYFRDSKYLVDLDRIYMFNDGEGWKCTKNFIFISPVDFIQDKELHRADKDEEEHVGIVKYSTILKKGTRVGFTKNSEYEFEVDGEKLYRMKLNDICVKFT